MQDARLLVSGAISGVNNAITGQTVTGNGATVFSTYSVDQTTAMDMGEGRVIYLKATVQTAFAGGTSLQIEPIASTLADIGSGTITSLGSTVEPLAELVAGYTVYVPLMPLRGSIGAQFLGARYTISGNMTAGVLVAELTTEMSDPLKSYKSGFTLAS